MATIAPKPCRVTGCGLLVRDGSGFCDNHADRRVTWNPDRERGNRHQRGLGTDYDKLRPLVIQRDRGLCQSCEREGRITAFNQIDHIVPRSLCLQVGQNPNTMDNLECICAPCHVDKTAREKRRG